MKTTGMVRRVDGLGRIVIPKEIRKTLKIKENEQIEINVLDKEIILNKYSNFNEYDNALKNLIDVISDIYKVDILITDLSDIKITSKNYLYVENKEISLKLSSIIDNRDEIDSDVPIRLCDNLEINDNYYIKNININGDSIGLVIFISSNKIDSKLITLISLFLEKYLE